MRSILAYLVYSGGFANAFGGGRRRRWRQNGRWRLALWKFIQQQQQQHVKKTDCTQQAEAERVGVCGNGRRFGGHLGHPPARRCSLAEAFVDQRAVSNFSCCTESAISCAWRKHFLARSLRTMRSLARDRSSA